MAQSQGNDSERKPTVVFYSGYKESETPRTVLIEGTEYPIKEIIWRKRVFDPKLGEMREAFKCRIEKGTIRIERVGSGEWQVFFCKRT
jgi:hypothetical protein